MTPFTALNAGIQPYLIWIKIIGVLLIVAAIFGGGYKTGSMLAHAEDGKALSALQKEYDGAKVVWSDTKTRMAADAAQVLADRDKANAAELAAKQTQIDSLIAKNQAAIKEIQNAKQAALQHNAHPTVTADPATDGLWVDVTTDSCTGNPDGSGLLSQAAAGRPLDSSYRCRLHQATADRLVEAAAKASEVAQQLNNCVAEVKVFTLPSISDVTTIRTDLQDGKGMQP